MIFKDSKTIFFFDMIKNRKNRVKMSTCIILNILPYLYIYIYRVYIIFVIIIVIIIY